MANPKREALLAKRKTLVEQIGRINAQLETMPDEEAAGPSAQLIALNQAIDKLGGITLAAQALGVTVSAVQQWRATKVPVERAKQLEQVTGVKRQRLRPDLYDHPGDK